MKTTEQNFSRSDMAKNVAAGGFAGAAYGLLLAVGFDWGIVLGLVTGMLFGMAVGLRLTRRPPKMRYPMYLFRRTMVVAAAFILGALFYSILLDRELSRPQALLAVLPALAGWAFLIISIGMIIASMDEMQRRIQIEAVAIGFAGTVILVGGYAMLGFADFPQVNWGVVIIVMAVMWLVGKLWTLWRYR
jgi:hypothetical protein